MKKAPYCLLILISCIVISCSNENLDEVISDQTDTNNSGNITDPDIPPNVITTPCGEIDIKEGGEIIIDCVWNLNENTINIPTNVTLKFGKGDIINGTLNFSNGGKIAGELLNATLKIKGDVELIDNDPDPKILPFKFYASRWDIVEGKTTKLVAFKNHENIQEVVNLIKKLKGTTFMINKLDAYFEANSGVHFGTPAIELPSDFHLQMSENTYLRVFPVQDPKFTTRILKIYKGKNITVSGGFIIGDRKERKSNEGGNVLFEIKGGQNIIIKNVTMNFSSLTGLTINSELFPGDSDYIPSKNVLVTNCTFDSNRANNLSITDGEDIIVEQCKSYRAGIDIGNSKGTAPRIGIVVEPVQGQKVERVIIRDNIVKESAGNSILIAWGNDFEISGNKAENGVGWNGASNVRIINNPSLEGGIIAGFHDGFTLSHSIGNVISGNKILNTPTGIQATNDDIKIFENTITNCKVGMMLRNLADTDIYNNTITSNIEDSFGFNAQNSINNVIIKENTVTLENGRSISMEGINTEDTYKNNLITIRDNTFKCGKAGRILYSNGFHIIENTFYISGFGITSSQNILVHKNRIEASNGQSALYINNYTSVKDIAITENTFDNRSSSRLSAYGLKINIVGNNALAEDTNIVIKKNVIKTLGENFGIHLKGLNGLDISNNTISISSSCCISSIYFRGNNSKIQNNKVLNTDIKGNNNIIDNNKL